MKDKGLAIAFAQQADAATNAKAELFTDVYRTRNGNLMIEFRCARQAGATQWTVALRYGDARITNNPDVFFDLGLKIPAQTRAALLDRLADLADALGALSAPQDTVQKG